MDLKAISSADLADTWVYNKLLVSLCQGIACGTDSREAPEIYRGKWVVIRPIINLEGMGLGSTMDRLKLEENNIPPGHFWQQKFEGRHLSIDYEYGTPMLWVEMFREDTAPYRRGWRKVEPVTIPVPQKILDVIKKYPKANIEFIDDAAIEVHLRGNPDFVGHRSEYVIPYNKSTPMSQIIEGERVILRPDYGREGFIIKEE